MSRRKSASEAVLIFNLALELLEATGVAGVVLGLTAFVCGFSAPESQAVTKIIEDSNRVPTVNLRNIFFYLS
jgi:hypothetical protein